MIAAFIGPIAALSAFSAALSALDWAGRVAVYILILGLLIVIHELGHMVAAKKAGVTVAEFAFGFGPRLFAVERGGTLYTVNLLPIGGFCRMVGEDTADDGSADPGNFAHKPLASRFAIIAAGPIFNFVLAAVLFSVMAIAVGQPTPTNVVQSVTRNSPAAAAGLKAGDEISMLNGQAFRGGQELVDYIHARPDQYISVDLVRDGQPVHMRIKTMQQADKTGAFGFFPVDRYVRMNVLAGIAWGLEQVPTVAAAQSVGIVQTIAHHDASQLAGPVGMARMVIDTEAVGIGAVLLIAGAMSVVLGMFNLLPIPALDGGRLAFLLVELVRGRRVDPEKEALVHLTGFALLMVFIAFISYHDIAQWVSGKGAI